MYLYLLLGGYYTHCLQFVHCTHVRQASNFYFNMPDTENVLTSDVPTLCMTERMGERKLNPCFLSINEPVTYVVGEGLDRECLL